jgi:hypothetical protein
LPERLLRSARPYVIVTGLLLLFYLPLFLPGNTIISGDYVDFHVPVRVHATRALWEGRVPLWAEELFGGYPFFADPQSAVFAPTNLVFALLFPRGESSAVFDRFVVAHQWLVAMGAVFLARSVGLSGLAAIVCAVILTLGGYNIRHLTHINIFTAIGFGLFMLGAMLRYRRHMDIRWMIAAGVLYGTTILSSHPQYTLHLSYAAIALSFYTFVALRGRMSMVRRLVVVGLPFVLGTAAAAVQLLPTREYLLVSSREEMALADSLLAQIPGRRIPSILFPHLYAPFWWRLPPGLSWDASNIQWAGGMFWEYALHLGLVTVTLALFGLVVSAAYGRRRMYMAIMLAAVALVCWVIALGQNGGLYLVLFQYMPGFKNVRVPPRIVWIGNIAVAVLVGMAIDAVLFRRDAKLLHKARIASVLFVLLVATCGLGLMAYARVQAGNWPDAFLTLFALSPTYVIGRDRSLELFVGDIWAQVAVACAFALALIAVLAFIRRLPASISAGLLALLLVLELGIYGFHKHVAVGNPGFTRPIGREIAAGEGVVEGRLALGALGPWSRNTALIANGVKLTAGYNPLLPLWVETLVPTDGMLIGQKTQEALLDLWNVEGKLVPSKPLEGLPAGVNGNITGFVELAAKHPDFLDSVSWDISSTQPLKTAALLSSTVFSIGVTTNTPVATIECFDVRGELVTSAPVLMGRDTSDYGYDGAPFSYHAKATPLFQTTLFDPHSIGWFYIATFDLGDTTIPVERVRITSKVGPDSHLLVSHLIVADSQDNVFVRSAPEAFGYTTPEMRSRSWDLIRRTTALGEAWLVPTAKPVSYKKLYGFVRGALHANDWSATQTVLLDKRTVTTESLLALNAPADATLSATTHVEHVSPEHVRITAETNERGWLVLSRTWYPNWRAFLDGNPVMLYQANGAHCAVAIPAGKHVLELRYVDRAFQVGAVISGFTWIGSVFALVVLGRRRRRILREQLISGRQPAIALHK